MKKKSKALKHGTVKKIFKSPDPRLPDKAEVEVHEADEVYKEIRIDNVLEDERGNKVKLKEDAGGYNRSGRTGRNDSPY